MNQPYGRILEQLHDRAAFTIFMSGDDDREDGKRVACVEYEPKQSLLNCGYTERQVAAMLTALQVEADSGDERSLNERLEALARQLEKYQRKTAFLVAQQADASPDFRTVNSELKERMGGKERERYTEADYTEALAVHAPRVRGRLLQGPLPDRG